MLDIFLRHSYQYYNFFLFIVKIFCLYNKLVNLKSVMQPNLLSNQKQSQRQLVESKKSTENNIDQKYLRQSENQCQFNYDDDTPLIKPVSTKLDLKSFWLSNTETLLNNFDEKLNQVKQQQQGIKQGFKIFYQNQEKYRLSSLRKIKIDIDHKLLYSEYLLKTRQQIEKINPNLLLNIFSYVDAHLFMALVKARKISKIFNQIYKNQSIQMFLAQKDYLKQEATHPIKSSIQMCKRYIKFYRTFEYYKSIHYSETIPQNSIMKDFEEAVGFINEVHKIVYTKKSRNFTYFSLINNFMTRNRVVIGLSSLSLTELVLVRKAAIIAFSNYLALNVDERSHDQITKTKHSKVVAVVEHENYRDSLIINTKVSNYLLQHYNLNFAVFITNQSSQNQYFATMSAIKVHTWDILIFHRRNELKNAFLQYTVLKDNKYQTSRMDLQFAIDMNWCIFSVIQFQNWVKYESVGAKLITLIETAGDQQYFSFCWVYHLEDYYIILMPKQFQ